MAPRKNLILSLSKDARRRSNARRATVGIHGIALLECGRFGIDRLHDEGAAADEAGRSNAAAERMLEQGSADAPPFDVTPAFAGMTWSG